jgi:hypothetical protein
VPALQSRAHFTTTDVDEETERARRRLRDTLETAREHGLSATGPVGDPIDPFAGLEDELRSHRVEEIVVPSHPDDSANWVESALLRRIGAELHMPIRHMVVERPASSAPRG